MGMMSTGDAAAPDDRERVQVTNVDDAIDVVARKLIVDLVASEASSRWDLYPEVGERDWERVVARALELAGLPVGYLSAYSLLAGRAERTIPMHCTVSAPGEPHMCSCGRGNCLLR